MPARHAGAKLNYDCMALINAGSTGRRRAVLAGRHFPARSARVVRLRHRASPLMYFFSETTTPPRQKRFGLLSPGSRARNEPAAPCGGTKGRGLGRSGGRRVCRDEESQTRPFHDRFVTKKVPFVGLFRRFVGSL